jgi:hypothetical protein
MSLSHLEMNNYFFIRLKISQKLFSHLWTSVRVPAELIASSSHSILIAKFCGSPGEIRTPVSRLPLPRQGSRAG